MGRRSRRGRRSGREAVLRASLAALALALCVRGARGEAADITVAPGGSIAAAVNSARPGDRVVVHAGTYPGGGWIGPVHGTEAAPITVVSVDGPRAAVIAGGGESLRVGDGSSYLVFDGFEVRNAGDNAVHIDGLSHHITLRNLFVHDAGFDGDVVKVNQAHDITVERSELARPGLRPPGGENPSQECIDFVDVDNVVLRDNWIHDGGSMLGYVKGGSRNALIERNVFSQQRAGASDPAFGLGAVTDPWLLGGERYEVIGAVFRNNVVVGATQGALGIYDASGAYVANNLFLNNDRAVIEFRAGSGPAGGSDDVRVVDNLVVDTRGEMPAPFLLSSHALTGLVTSYNQFWNGGAPVPASPLVALEAQPGHLLADPLLGGVPAPDASRDAVIAAVRPGAGSPAAGSGIDASGAPFGVLDDITAAARSGRLDRGPFALAPSAVTPPPHPTPPTFADAGDAQAGEMQTRDADAGDADAADAGAAAARDAAAARRGLAVVAAGTVPGGCAASRAGGVAAGCVAGSTAGAPGRRGAGLALAALGCAALAWRRRQRDDE